jgi:hypothetical protein
MEDQAIKFIKSFDDIRFWKELGIKKLGVAITIFEDDIKDQNYKKIKSLHQPIQLKLTKQKNFQKCQVL